jgi:hypothetical protein
VRSFDTLASCRLDLGSAWANVTLPLDTQVLDEWARGRDDLFACTLHGVVHFDGSTWTLLGPPRTCALIAGYDDGVLIAQETLTTAR